ncbi:hypothetical protein BH20ACT11_BH20ACT11_09240 [soil metagenome]
MESVEQSKRERLARAFIEGAETGMVECRGYGLSASEREEAERLADYLYRKPLEEVAVAS